MTPPAPQGRPEDPAPQDGSAPTDAANHGTAAHGAAATGGAAPTRAQVRRWQRYLADERAEGAIYRDLASRRTGEEREILLELARAEQRHEEHWRRLLGDHLGHPKRAALRTRLIGWLARRFGSVFVLALVQRSESRSQYAADADATTQMAADEQIHEEVVRSLAARGRNQISGMFRAGVFGANDGLVSNLALVLGFGATGASSTTVLFAGLAGLLAGALSMAAGEYVSVSSQRELVNASEPDPQAAAAVKDLDVDANELALVYRARGMSAEEAAAHAAQVIEGYQSVAGPDPRRARADDIGTPWSAATSSFVFFASGALLPVIPYIFGMAGTAAVITAAVIVGVALLVTGGFVGLMSGASPARRGLRQLAIGWGAAAATYLLGSLFGFVV